MKRLIAALALSLFVLLPSVAIAEPYGGGNFGGCDYNEGCSDVVPGSGSGSNTGGGTGSSSNSSGDETAVVTEDNATSTGTKTPTESSDQSDDSSSEEVTESESGQSFWSRFKWPLYIFGAIALIWLIVAWLSRSGNSEHD